MQPTIKLGRIFGIEIGLHDSWFLIALLITLSLAGQFTATQPQWGGAVIWSAALVTLQDLVDDLLRTGRLRFVVVDGGTVVGLITPNEVKEVPRQSWAEVRVAEAMRRRGQLRTVEPDTSVADSLEIMARDDIHQLPVVAAGGRLEGVISCADVMRVLSIRDELGA